MAKAQVSIEWLFSIGIGFIIFLFMLGISFEKRLEVIRIEKYTNLRNECLKISEIIVSSFLNGEGTRIQSTSDFNLTFDSKNRLISIGDNEIATCSIPLDRLNDVTTFKGGIISKNIGNFLNVSNV